MTSKNNGRIPAGCRPFPRRFVPDRAGAGSWPELAPLYRKLLRRPLDGPSALARWIEDWSELEALVDEESSRRYIAMTCRTADPTVERRYLEFVGRIAPCAKKAGQALRERYLALPARRLLRRRRRYTVFDRAVSTEARIFRKENVPLEARLDKLGQRFEKICGAMTVVFEGKERTLPQMGRFLEEKDRALRRRAWEAMARRRLEEKDRLDRLFLEMFRIRRRIAHNAGFRNYRDYLWRKYGRFDYTPADCRAFHKAVKLRGVPLLQEVEEDRRLRLAVPGLKPWDLAVDPEGRPPLRPFRKAAELYNGCVRILRRVDPLFGGQLASMRRLGNLDLESRKGKAPGGYQSTLSLARVPFIFMNAAGLNRDVVTLLHEAGHAAHALLCRNDPILLYRGAPMEFCEVASMSMELLALPHLSAFYRPAEARRARLDHLDGIVRLLPWIATIDAFQHEIYGRARLDPAGLRRIWVRVRRRFGGIARFEGFEDVEANLWQRQHHLFTSPFYYIEYGIAQLGALGVWRRARRNPGSAVAAYRRALSLGGSRPLPELFRAAGIRFDFSDRTVGPLIAEVRRAIAAAGAE